MNVNVTRAVEPISFEAFADKHGLTLSVHERRLDATLRRCNIKRWYAHFDHAEVKRGSVLISSYGDGDTPEEAIAAYAAEIRGEVLQITDFNVPVVEIQCPNEWEPEA